MTTERSPERIIILCGADAADKEAFSKLSRQIPNCEVVGTTSLNEYLSALGKGDFDVVVLDYDLPQVQAQELLTQLKVRDNEPEVLLVSSCSNPEAIKNIAKTQKRYVVRDESWVESVAHTVRDMLRIRRLEEEMALIRARLTEANDRLEARNRRLDDFCATIAHDIRGPLAGLVLKIEYVLETQATALDDRTVALLQRSIESTRRLVGVVQAMYEFAKIGFSGAKFSPVQLTPLVHEVMTDIHIDHSSAVGVKLQDLPTVWGNADLLRRVFQNLFSNSIKYGHQNRVEIMVSYDGKVQRGMGEFEQITVTDNGPGISPADAKNVFNMFSRGAGADRGSDGLGIGLAVVQRIVELHRGTIELSSEPGKGAKFTILLPVEDISRVVIEAQGASH